METVQLAAENLQDFINDGGVIIGVDVDTQSDFVDKNGALYVEAPEEVRSNLAKLTQSLIYRIGSVDSHAYDAWEFQANGGPFPAHCIKGEPGWMKIPETRLSKDGEVLPKRFVPMSSGELVIGENKMGDGNRTYDEESFTREVLDGVQVDFEKEVYSAFENPLAEEYIARLVEKVGGTRKALFAVYGYCTGGYCVDAFAEGLAERGYQTALIEDAVAPINFAPEDGAEQDGMARTLEMTQVKGISRLMAKDILNVI